jgi:hypothetical protein
MHFDTDLLAAWTLRSLVGADHFHFQAPVGLQALTEQAQSGQVQGDDDSLRFLCPLFILA